MTDLDSYVRFERIDSVTPLDSGILARLHHELLRIELVRADVVRVKISRGGAFDEAPTFAVCVDPLTEQVAFTIDHGDGVVRLKTSAMTVSVWLTPFRIDVHRTDGSAVIESGHDREGRYWTYATLNDAFVVRRRAQPEDAIYGLGEKAGDHNRRGRSFTLWNTDVLDPRASGDVSLTRNQSVDFDPYYISVPFFYHQDNGTGAITGSFIDNGYRATYDFTAADEYLVHFDGGQYTEYIFAGPQMSDILAHYVWLTGHMAPPPLWALGFHQCRWFDYTQETLEDLARELRAQEIPCDALWLDIDYMDGYRVFTWDTEKFPDVPGMLARLAELGYRVITIVDPGVKHEDGYWVYDQARERGLLCLTEGGDVYIGQVWPGNTAFPDFATEEARAWWGELNAVHVRSGLAGIWNDMNEPATGAIEATPMRFGRGQFSHERFHNQYALLMAMGTTAGLRKAMPELRTFVLSRAGFAGIQRYAANWLGDNVSRWDHLWLSIPMACGLGISGQPFVGADIGGFIGDTNSELLVRWMQYGTLTPFARTHSVAGSADQYAWSFGPDAEDLIRAAIALRYRLLPYIYAAFLRACESGVPVQRPLVFDDQYDPRSRDIDDQYLFGPDMLVAPVLAQGMTAREVYLPAGQWYDWHTGVRFEGQQWVTAPTPIDRIPIYARAGAVIPMWDRAPTTTLGHQPREIELHLFVPANGESRQSVLVEDDGLTFAALGGAFYRTVLDVTRQSNVVTLRADVAGAGFPEFARESIRLILHGATLESVTINGEPTATANDQVVWKHRAEAFVVELMLADEQ